MVSEPLEHLQGIFGTLLFRLMTYTWLIRVYFIVRTQFYNYWIREAFKKKNCIFYDIWQKGRGSKDQNQISEKNLNLDKVLGGVGKRLQCHKNSYLKNLVFYCLFCQKISIFYTPLSSLWHFYYYNCLCLWHLLLLQLLLHR